MKFRPMNNVVVVEPDEVNNVSKGGIIEVNKKVKVHTGTVVSFGKGVLNDKQELVSCGVEVGDRIVWLAESHEKTFEVDNEEIVCIKANGILGKLTAEE